MIHAGVSEAVLISYVTNSTTPFFVSADQVVYLKDIGASSELITTLIVHDNRPEIAAQKKASMAAKPLPDGVAVNTPVAGVYPGAPVPAEPTPVANAGASAAPPPPEAAQTAALEAPTQPVETATFYTTLAPYGTWIDIPDYGYCWRPTVAIYTSGWAPYRDCGRWLWSDCGWYWYSDYSWGWAPFHYGRWCTYPGYGWVWVPGSVWGPAWVTWRYSDAYCGWAPLPPACGFSAGVGLTWGGGAVGVGFGFGISSSCYTFVGWNNFCSPRPYRYYAPHGVVQNFFKNTVVINNYVVNNRTVVNKGVGTERIAGPVPRATIRETSYSGGKVAGASARRETLRSDGVLNVYRPEYIGAMGGTPNSRPTRAAANAGAKPGLAVAERPSTASRIFAAPRASTSQPIVTGATSVPQNAGSRPPAAAPPSRLKETPRTGSSGAPRTSFAPRTSPSVSSGQHSTPGGTGTISPSVGISSSRSTPTTTSVAPGASSLRSTPSVSSPSRPATSPTLRSPAPAGRPASPSVRSTPFVAPSRPAASVSSPAPVYRAPSPALTPAYRAPAPAPAPAYRAPAPAPSYRAPSRPAPAPHYSAPAAPSHSSPAIRSAPSSPTPSRSTPSGGRNSKN